jgi:hypothetical protein
MPDERVDSDEVHDFLVQKERFERKARRELRRTAYHEAGHAFFYVRNKSEFEWVGVRPFLPDESPWWAAEEMDPFEFGRVHIDGRIREDDIRRQWHEQLTVTLAGPLAEAKHLQSSRPLIRGHDRVLIKLCLEGCWSNSPDRIFRDHVEFVRMIVDRHWPEIEAIASALIDRRFLTAKEVRRIVKVARG